LDPGETCPLTCQDFCWCAFEGKWIAPGQKCAQSFIDCSEELICPYGFWEAVGKGSVISKDTVFFKTGSASIATFSNDIGPGTKFTFNSNLNCNDYDKITFYIYLDPDPLAFGSGVQNSTKIVLIDANGKSAVSGYISVTTGTWQQIDFPCNAADPLWERINAGFDWSRIKSLETVSLFDDMVNGQGYVWIDEMNLVSK
jgi:hypothetical protein